MIRYRLNEIYNNSTELVNGIKTQLGFSYSALLMGLNATAYNDVVAFIGSAIYYYFYKDLLAYTDEDDVQAIFIQRLSYDVAVKLPYWYKKYNYIKKLLTTEDLSLLQTSKMTSSSNDTTKGAGGTLQKTATTPTGVSATTSTDSIDIDIKSGTDDGDNDIETDGFADKYTNAQQKFANASRVESSRSGNILREGSIDDLLKVLEKLPSSFADEVCKAVQSHFIFDYDGDERGIYNEL